MASLQNTTVEGLLATLGLTGYTGISAAANDGDDTQLDITVSPPTWAIVGDGTLLTTELVDTSVLGLSTDDTYHLYLDYEEAYEALAPVWTVATSAPSSRAIKVADVTVGSNVISNVTMVQVGFLKTPLANLNIVSTDT